MQLVEERHGRVLNFEDKEMAVFFQTQDCNVESIYIHHPPNPTVDVWNLTHDLRCFLWIPGDAGLDFFDSTANKRKICHLRFGCNFFRRGGFQPGHNHSVCSIFPDSLLLAAPLLMAEGGGQMFPMLAELGNKSTPWIVDMFIACIFEGHFPSLFYGPHKTQHEARACLEKERPSPNHFFKFQVSFLGMYI